MKIDKIRKLNCQNVQKNTLNKMTKWVSHYIFANKKVKKIVVLTYLWVEQKIINLSTHKRSFTVLDINIPNG